MIKNSSIQTERSKLITCILPKGTGKSLVQKLKDEKNVTTSFFSNARGTGMVKIVGRLGWGQQIEKDVVMVVVSSRRATEVFDYIYFTMKIDQPHGGFIYMGKFIQSVPFLLPELSELSEGGVEASPPPEANA